MQERRRQARGWEESRASPQPLPHLPCLSLFRLPSAFPHSPGSQALTLPQLLLLPSYFTFYLPGTLEFTKCVYIYHCIESTPGRDRETSKIPSNCQVFLLKMQTSPEDEQLGWQPLVPQTNLFHPLPRPQPLSTSGWGWGGGRGRSSAFGGCLGKVGEALGWCLRPCGEEGQGMKAGLRMSLQLCSAAHKQPALTEP